MQGGDLDEISLTSTSSPSSSPVPFPFQFMASEHRAITTLLLEDFR